MLSPFHPNFWNRFKSTPCVSRVFSECFSDNGCQTKVMILLTLYDLEGYIDGAAKSAESQKP